MGLVALAVSDAAFCLVYLLATVLLPTRAKYAPDDNRAALYFGIYHEVRAATTRQPLHRRPSA